MNTLQQEITGKPVTVVLRDKEYMFDYAIEAVTLYQQQTIEIDRRRATGKEKLKPADVRELRSLRAELKAQMRALAVPPGESMTSETVSKLESLMEESIALKCKLDEDAGAGDNLFIGEDWRKIRPEQDPERFLACLWAGLSINHPELTIKELGRLVHFGNSAHVLEQMTRAMISYFPAQKEANPNDLAPEKSPAAK